MRALILSCLLCLMLACTNNEKMQVITLDSLDENPKPDTTKLMVQAAIDSAINQETKNSGAQDSIQIVATQILTALKNKNYGAFANYFHPTIPVVFSPYGFIDKAACKKLLAKDFLESIEKNWTLTWGSYDGTGQAIKLKVLPYLDKFVYNADYLAAEQHVFDQVINRGNSINNIETVFPHLHFMEYHFSGFDKKLEGMDWSSLRLVFKQSGGKYYLVGVIHDQWTT